MSNLDEYQKAQMRLIRPIALIDTARCNGWTREQAIEALEIALATLKTPVSSSQPLDDYCNCPLCTARRSFEALSKTKGI